MRKPLRRARYLAPLFPAIFFGLVLISCNTSSGTSTKATTTTDETYNVVPVSFATEAAAGIYAGSNSLVTPVSFASASDSPVSVTLHGLTGQNVFLAKVNTGSTAVAGSTTGNVTASSVVSASSGTISLSVNSARSAASVSSAGFLRDAAEDSRIVSGAWNGFIRYDYEPARKTYGTASAGSARNAASSSEYTVTLPRGSTADSSTTYFWVQNSAGSWVQTPATCRAVGTYCNIWVADANYLDSSATLTDNKITTVQAESLAAKFDIIYPVETNVLGYEYGGGLASGATGYGGKDGDPLINILVYDIDGDYTSTQTSGTFGYFWSKDYYDDGDTANIGTNRSNEGEIFYLDSYFTDRAAPYIYSTLVHEFQHMINFNRKKIVYNLNAESWYNEMLSLVSEDMIDSWIGITPAATGYFGAAHPVNSRIPLFTGFYDYTDLNATDWSSTNSDVLEYYSNAYAFGAYLARNYGGAQLIKAIEDTDSIGEASISGALASVNTALASYNATTATGAFTQAVRNYAQALVYSGTNVATYCGTGTKYGLSSFDRAVSTSLTGYNITQASSYTYTFSAFDIWDQKNYFAGYYGVSSTYTGPLVWALSQYAIPAYAVTLQSDAGWQNVTGDLTVTLSKPTDTNVELYLMIR